MYEGIFRDGDDVRARFGCQGTGLKLGLALVGEAIAHANEYFPRVRYLFKVPHG